jgi:hypothetical protein
MLFMPNMAVVLHGHTILTLKSVDVNNTVLRIFLTINEAIHIS